MFIPHTSVVCSSSDPKNWPSAVSSVTFAGLASTASSAVKAEETISLYTVCGYGPTGIMIVLNLWIRLGVQSRRLLWKKQEERIADIFLHHGDWLKVQLRPFPSYSKQKTAAHVYIVVYREQFFPGLMHAVGSAM